MRRFHTDKGIYVLHYAAGEAVAKELCSGLDAIQVSLTNGTTKDAFESRWGDAGAFVFVGALAIAVRSVAHLLRDKATDPAITVVSEDGGVALPVLAGHIGLAADLARECAGILSSRGALYVPTTSSDRAGFTAPDLWASRRGYPILLRGKLAAVINKFKAEGGISAWIDPVISERGIYFPLPFGYSLAGEQDDADVIISPRSIQRIAAAKPQIVPRLIVAGVGCRAGVSAETIDRVVKSALSSNGSGPFLVEALAEIRTVEAKRGEPGIKRFAESHKLPLVIVSDKEVLAMGNVFTPSAAAAHIGLPGAAEPSAASAGALFGQRVADAGVTVALSMTKPRESGDLHVIGTGPGSAKYVTMEARAAIDASEIVMGYKHCLDMIPETWTRGKIVERYGMGEEEDSVCRAFSHVASGYRVALLSGGDASLFGLAPLCMSMLPDSIGPDRVRIVPGLTAAQTAGTAIGAPYTNGLVQLSLSDYLQPWSDIVSAMEGAMETGAAVALYNPVEKGLAEKLNEVGRIFGDRRAVIIRGAGRPEESAAEKPAREITQDDLDMGTMIFILSPKTRERSIGGRKLWIEARGYRSEAEFSGEPDKPELGQFLVLGGTTEGREAASRLIERGYKVTLSVTRKEGAILVPEDANILIGARDASGWADVLNGGDGLFGVIDATHPFAVEASSEIALACARARIPLCRLARPEETPEEAIIAPDVEGAADLAVKKTKNGDLIFLAIGTNDLGKVMPRLRKEGRRVLARMLPTVASMRQAERSGLSPTEIIASWGSGGAEWNVALCRERNAKCIVSRESGAPGHIAEKSAAAKELGIPLVLIARPAEPEGVPRAEGMEELLAWCGEQAGQ